MATDWYQLRVQGIHQTEYNECVLHFKGVNLDVADYVQNAQDLLATFEANWTSNWLNLLPESYCLMRLSAKKKSAGGGGEVVTEYQYGDNLGTVGGGAASQQLCPVITLIPPMGIKSAGRMFLPCIAEGQIAANVVNTAWKTAVASIMATFIAGASNSSINWTQAIYSRRTSSFSDVVDYSLSPTVGFQRRRQRSPL